MRAAPFGAALVAAVLLLSGCASPDPSSERSPDPSAVGAWGDLEIAYPVVGQDELTVLDRAGEQIGVPGRN